MSNYHISAGHGVKQFYQFDGTRYNLTKRIEWGNPPTFNPDHAVE
jgi:hypothetical protein